MYFVQILGLMLATLGVAGVLLPFVPSGSGDAAGTSLGLVLGSLAALAVGVVLFVRARRDG